MIIKNNGANMTANRQAYWDTPFLCGSRFKL